MQIEKNVPMPNARTDYPYKYMEVGDSVLIDHSCGNLGAAQAYAHVYGRQAGRKFRTRTIPEGLRVWRVA